MVNPEDSKPTEGRKNGKFRRAKLRHTILTLGANRLSGGRLLAAHLAKALVVRELEVTMPGWPRAWDGLRVGHFSDLHFGDLMPVDRGLEVIDLLGARSPDLIACTGDMIDLECGGAEPLFERMVAIDAPLGAMMVMGNHDLLDDGERVRSMAKAAGVRLLEDEAITFARDVVSLPHVGRGEKGGQADHPLVVAGVDWDGSVSGLARRVEAVSPVNPTLLLAHNPKAFLPASRAGIPLTLAGHTHGGQIATPKLPGVNLALAHRHSAGFYHRDTSTLFVTVGTGSWFPLRVHCPAEVVVLTCRSGETGVREIE
ncbi:MAG: metallophosphoesterase family protein [Phycisphaerales bacterium]|nr:metallophosphoesterase family protein [Phycisphaerales bacterium]